MKEIKVLITLRSRFISVNNLYKARLVYSAGHPRATIYKNPKAIKVEEEVRDQLRAVDFTEHLDWLRTCDKYDLSLYFILKKNATRIDSSNLIKNVEDIWTRFVVNDLGISGYDDSMHVQVQSQKSTIPGATNEYVLLVLRESTSESLRFDLKPLPEKIYTYGDNTLNFPEDPPKKKRKKDPQLPYLVKEVKDADTFLKIVRPSSSFSGIEAIEFLRNADQVVKRSKGFIYLGILGEESDYSKEDWDIVNYIKDELNKFELPERIRAEKIDNPDSIKTWINSKF